MTLQECYAAMGGNYDEVLGRLRSDRLIQKFVLKFVDDGSYQLLLDSMASQNYEDAFRLSEALRHGYTPEADALAEQVGRDYQDTVCAIRAFQASVGT